MEEYTSLNEYLIEEKSFKLPVEIRKYFLSDGVNSKEAIDILEKFNIKVEIEKCLKEFNSVFPRINNVSAKDSRFVILEMKCCSIEDIFILLKYSSRIRNLVQNSLEHEIFELI